MYILNIYLQYLGKMANENKIKHLREIQKRANAIRKESLKEYAKQHYQESIPKKIPTIGVNI